MFSIVSMQDVLINLKGGDALFKMFDKPRSRQKNSTSKNLGNQSTFPIKKVWVLPSHIITMVTSGNKEDMIAYDQLPKLGSNKNDEVKLLEQESSGVFDLFQTVVNSQEFIFIVFKTGLVHVWCFCRPEYEWKKLKEFTLCKGRDSHIVSCVYDQKLQLVVWCEKRSATQFCICKIRLTFSSGAVQFEESKTILHNCLPMDIYGLAKGHFVFIPVSNKTLGLFLFYCLEDEKITVRMWGDTFNDHKYVSFTTDYQTIVRDCLYLWINRINFENKVISLTSHPSSQELVVLQNDLKVYKICMVKDGHKAEASLLCTLEEFPEGGEAFSKQIVKCYPYQRMLLLLMVDGTINIFENQGGLFLWKTETFRTGGPQIWIRKGNYPAAGVWNRSGIWSLRSKPIAEQLKEVLVKQNLISDGENGQHVTKELQGDKVKDPEFALDVFEEQKKQQKPKSRKLKIKQGVNRSEDIPIASIFNILNMWQLGNVSAETALSLAVRINDMRDNEDDPNLSELFCLIDEIKDPVLLLVLFGSKNFPFCVKKKLTSRLRTLMRHANIKRLDPEILSLLQQYMDAEKQITDLFMDGKDTNYTEQQKTVARGGNVVKSEMLKIEKFVTSLNYHISSLDKLLTAIMDLNIHDCMTYLLYIFIGREECVDTCFNSGDVVELSDKVVIECWKTLLRHDSKLFTKFFTILWQEEPKLVLAVIEKAQKITALKSNEMFPIVFKVEKSVEKIWTILFLPEISDPHHTTKLRVYKDLCKLTGNENLYGTFLDHQMIDEAFQLLGNQDKDSPEHASMFYQMLTYLLENKLLGQYANKLSALVPSNFKMAEFCNVYALQAVEMGKSSVFVTNKREPSISEARLFLEHLL